MLRQIGHHSDVACSTESVEFYEASVKKNTDYLIAFLQTALA